ncbi:MAG: GvpL/GvpF family gas vesicle protein [Candidatus Eremiobacteraeota bacterium]|nr:GvpL/GvpF family gas vesicle protein [Candidatus Eremiobacteraeota bacterium]
MVRAELAGRRFIVEGRAAATIAYGNLALVVRDLDRSDWSDAVIAEKLNDPEWATRQAAMQQRVLERAMSAGPVVPARPLTILRREELETFVRDNGDRLRRTLARIAGKQEWCLHVYLGPHVTSHEEPYVMRVAPAVLPAPIEGPFSDHVTALWKRCSAVSFGARRIEPAQNPRYLFGATFLLARNHLREFRAALLDLASEAREMGLTYYLDGPHPPFTFT